MPDLDELDHLEYFDPRAKELLEELRVVHRTGLRDEAYFCEKVRETLRRGAPIPDIVRTELGVLAHRTCMPEEISRIHCSPDDWESVEIRTDVAKVGMTWDVPPVDGPFFARFVLTARGRSWWMNATDAVRDECFQMALMEPQYGFWLAIAWVNEAPYAYRPAVPDVTAYWPRFRDRSDIPAFLRAMVGVLALPHANREMAEEIFEAIVAMKHVPVLDKACGPKSPIREKALRAMYALATDLTVAAEEREAAALRYAIFFMNPLGLTREFLTEYRENVKRLLESGTAFTAETEAIIWKALR